MTSTIDPSQVITSIQQSLDSYFQESIDRAQSIDADYARLWQNMRDLSAAGGKRLRPQMTLMSYTAFGGQDMEGLIPVASAQELLHFSLLIHDDIIDRDDVRYGVSNMTGRYLDIYSSSVSDADERRHFSQSAALLGGDVLISSAYQIIIESNINDHLKIQALKLLGDGIFEVCGGELLDTEAAFKPFYKTNALTIARYKTASYSFTAPLLTGATLAGANPQQLGLLRTYAENLGVAYQLSDDLIGSFGDETITGKSSLGDIREAKHTYLIEQHIKNLSEDDQEKFWQVFGNAYATVEQITDLKQSIIDSGARQATEDYVDQLADQARLALEQLNLDKESRDKFSSLVTKATKRDF